MSTHLLNAIRLPSAKILYSRLTNMGLKHFVENTKLHERLGDQEKRAITVLSIVDHTIRDYTNTVDDYIITSMITADRNHIIKSILEDHPQTFADLSRTPSFKNPS